MWRYIVSICLIVCVVGIAVPGRNEITQTFTSAIQHQDLQTILSSIEERLRNLDNVYAMHLSPTLEQKFDQYQRKLEAIDTKILRFESLVILTLDKITENISMKNFKDDIARTNSDKKLDSTYEGLNHRLNYLEKKFETSLIKVQNKMDETLTKQELLETQLNEGFNELRTRYSAMEEVIVNNTNENFEAALDEQLTTLHYIQNSNEKANKMMKSMLEKLLHSNNTNQLLNNIKYELKTDLNEYAIKVGEMNAENWRTSEALLHHQNTIETTLNSTKIDLQNGMRIIMPLVGKINKFQLNDDLNKKIDVNFERVFSAQHLFLDSCHRLQKDEPQIESKIGEILEKLIEMFEDKSSMNVRGLEKMVKQQNVHVMRNVHETRSYLRTVYEKMSKDHMDLDGELKRVIDHINVLFLLVQDTLVDETGSVSNVQTILQQLNDIQRKIGGFYNVSEIESSTDEFEGTTEESH